VAVMTIVPIILHVQRQIPSWPKSQVHGHNI